MTLLFNPYTWLALVLYGAASFGMGVFHQYKSNEKSRKADAYAQLAANFENQRLANRSNAGVTDAYHQANAKSDAATALASKRLRDLSAARSEAASACSRLDEPAVGILPPDVRDALILEAKRADEAARKVTALQQYVREVCKPDALAPLSGK